MHEVEYTVRRSARAQRVRITVHADGRIIVTSPPFMPMRVIEAFVRERARWVVATQARMHVARVRAEKNYGTRIPLPRLRRGTTAYNEAIARARSIATERVQHFARLGGFNHGAISIRNQKTRWGSCSARGNLSFNYRLVHLPPALVDYLIVHELAHTKHHNHSAAFWAEVGKWIPVYKECRTELRR
jgi:predicted metal-dependent hydrolase